MSKTIRLLAVTLAGISLGYVNAQDFNQFAAGPTATGSQQVAQAVYAGLSDGADQRYAHQQVAYKSINDQGISTTTSVVPRQKPTASTVTAPVAQTVLPAPTPTPTPIAPAIAPSVPVEQVELGAGVTGHSVASPSVMAAPMMGSPVATPAVGASCGVNGCTDPSCSAPHTALPPIDASYQSAQPAAPWSNFLGGHAGGACDDGCDGACGNVACGSLIARNCISCCGVGTHYSRVFGGALYMRARGGEIVYAVPFNGPVGGGQATPIQVGNIGILDPDYELGYYGGVNVALDTVSSIQFRYTFFENSTSGETSTTAPNALRSLVTHPSSATAAQDGLSSVANLDIDFQTADVNYRHLLKCGELFAANYVVGARYAQLEQNFDVDFVKNGVETVTTDIDFNGAGLRLGLETERYSCRNQLHVYANGYASFLAGRFKAHYFQGQAFDPSVVNTEWEAGRIVPILDLEAGLGWNSRDGRLSLSAGYLVSAWFNTVTTQEYINAVQGNEYLDMSDTLTFDGVQARVEYRF